MKKKFKKAKPSCKTNTCGTNQDQENIPQNEEGIKLTAVRFNVNFFEKKKDEENHNKDRMNQLVLAGHNFTTVLQMLWKYINSIGLLAETTSNTSIGTLFVILDEIERIAKNRKDSPIAELEIQLSGTGKDEKDEEISRKLKIYEQSHLIKVLEFKRHNEAALTILHETAIQQLINSWEKLLADIINWYYENNPNKISKERKISYNKILQFSSLDEAKRHVIDDEIKQFLSLTENEQYKFINDSFGVNFQSSFKNTDFLNELILCRHLIVHYGGIVTNEFVNRLGNIKNKKTKGVKVGEKLNLEPGYIISSWGIVYVAGVILTHLISRKVLPELSEIADNFLNTSAFLAIQNKQLESAKFILEYAKGIHIFSNSRSYVNYLIL